MRARGPLFGMVALWLAWGSSFLAIRVMVQTIPPLLGAGVAFVAAGLTLSSVVVATGHARMDRAGWWAATSSGLLLLVGGQGLLTVAEQDLPSGPAAIVIAAVPLWMTLLRLAGGDRLGRVGVVRMFVGFIGVAVLVLGTSTTGAGAPWALAAALCASLSWAVGSVLGARAHGSSAPVVTLTAVQILVGGVVLVLLGVALGPPVAWSRIAPISWAGLGYLALVDSLLGFLLYQWLLRALPITLASTYAYTVPVIAVVLGAVLLGESLSVISLLGGLVVVVCVAAEARSASRPS